MSTYTKEEVYKKIDDKVSQGLLRSDDAEWLKRINDAGPQTQSQHGIDTDNLVRLMERQYVKRSGGGFLQGAPTYEIDFSSLD